MNAVYDSTFIRERVLQRDASTPLQDHGLSLDGVVVCRTTMDTVLKENLGITDAKSLFDALKKQAKGKDPRIALAVGEIRQGMIACAADVRWIPHNHQLVDPLTKRLHKSNLQALMRTMRSGTYMLRSEEDEMAYRKRIRESGQTLQRVKGKAPVINQEDEDGQERFVYGTEFYNTTDPEEIGLVRQPEKHVEMTPRSGMDFDATLGYPGEGPPNSSVPLTPLVSRLGPPRDLDRKRSRICGRENHWGNECPFKKR